MKKVFKKSLAILLVMLIVVPQIGTMGASAKLGKNVYYSDGYVSTKISNPTSGEREADGILYGDESNRTLGYAWSLTYRDGYIYVGTDSNMYGMSYYAIYKGFMNLGINLSDETAWDIYNMITFGDIPEYNAADPDQLGPMIIKLDPETAETKIIYQSPRFANGFYQDTGFRVALNYNGDLYFGSVSNTNAQILRIDENDNVYLSYDAGNGSFRAATIYNDKLYFAGMDNTHVSDAEVSVNGAVKYSKGVFLQLDATTDDQNEDTWSRVADYSDFMPYSDIYGYYMVPADIAQYNDDMYAVIASGYSYGCMIFKGHPQNGDWVWEEVVGDKKLYSGYGRGFNIDDPATDVDETLAVNYTVCVSIKSFNGKLYMGMMDQWPTAVTTMTSGLFSALSSDDSGVMLSDALSVFYNLLEHSAQMYCLEEKNGVTTVGTVEGLNDMVDGTTIEYLWRFAEYNGELFLGTIDPATFTSTFTRFTDGSLLELSPEELVEELQYVYKVLQVFGIDAQKIKDIISNIFSKAITVFNGSTDNISEKLNTVQEYAQAQLDKAAKSGDAQVQEEASRFEVVLARFLKFVDDEGLDMYVYISDKMAAADYGCDVYSTKDGVTWKAVTTDGFGDDYNYGSRTLVACEDGVYIGTANPFYGAQIWKVVPDDSFGAKLMNILEDVFSPYTRIIAYICSFFKAIFSLLFK